MQIWTSVTYKIHREFLSLVLNAYGRIQGELESTKTHRFSLNSRPVLIQLAELVQLAKLVQFDKFFLHSHSNLTTNRNKCFQWIQWQIFCKKKRLFEPTTSSLWDQDVPQSQQDTGKRGSSNWPQFMLQWFIGFSGFFFHLKKTIKEALQYYYA